MNFWEIDVIKEFIVVLNVKELLKVKNIKVKETPFMVRVSDTQKKRK